MMRFILILFICALRLNLWAQADNTISFKSSKGKQLNFILKGAPVFEIVNGKMNIACQSSDGSMLQINSIDARKLKNKEAAVRNIEVKWLHLQQNKIATGLLRKNKILINCATCKTNDKITIAGDGHIYINNIRYLITFRLTGVIPAAEMLKTN